MKKYTTLILFKIDISLLYLVTILYCHEFIYILLLLLSVILTLYYQNKEVYITLISTLFFNNKILLM